MVFKLATTSPYDYKEVPVPGHIPAEIWHHFTVVSGFCVEFVFCVAKNPNSRIVDSEAPPPNPGELGVIVVDETGHAEFRFAEHHLSVVRTWEDYDSSATATWGGLWVHLTDFQNRGSAGIQQLEALVTGAGDAPEFADRGKRARRIVVFTGGGGDTLEGWKRSSWWQDGLRSRRLTALSRSGVPQHLDEFFTTEGLPAQIEEARGRSSEEAERYRKRLRILAAQPREPS